MPALTRWFRSGVLANLGVHLNTQLVQIAIQFAMVPLLIAAWGLPTYGVWLILFTVPGYLAVADLGLTTAGANMMVQKLTRGEREAAVRTYQAMRWAAMALTALAFAAMAAVIAWLGPSLLGFAESATGGRSAEAALALVAYGLLNIQLGLAYSGFRAIDRYVQCGYAVLALTVVEALSAMVLAALGYGIFALALSYLGWHLAACLALAAWLRRLAPWLVPWRPVVRRGDYAELVSPGVAGLLVPLTGAIVIQGSVTAIGAGAGPAAVPLFTTMRTVSRLPVQLATIASRAAMPAFTVADAGEDRHRRGRLVAGIGLASLVVLVPGLIAFSLFGPAFVSFWTAGEVRPPWELALVFGLAMVPGCLWPQLGEMLLAVNRHVSMAWFSLAAAILAVAATFLLARSGDVALAVVPLMILEWVMLWQVTTVARRLGFLDREELRRGFAGVRGRLGDQLARWSGR